MFYAYKASRSDCSKLEAILMQALLYSGVEIFADFNVN